MPISIATGRHILGGRTRGTTTNPESVLIDNAPTGAASANIVNHGQEAFFVRLNDVTLQTDWTRVGAGETAYLYLATTDPTSVEFARPRLATPRWIGANTPATFATWPFIFEVIPGIASSGGGGAPVTPGCCTTTNADITITNSSSGLVLTSPNGKQWRLGAENTGALSTDPLP